MYSVFEHPFDPITEIVLRDGSVNSKGSVLLHVSAQEITDALNAADAVDESEAGFEWDCTPDQVEILGSLKSSIIRLDVPAQVVENLDELCSAWHILAKRNHQLRTVIVKVKDKAGSFKYRQRILKRATDVRLGPFTDFQPIHSIGEPALLVLDWSSGPPTIYLRILNAIADHTSLGNLWRDFLSILVGDTPKPRPVFPDYSHLESAKSFWAETLGNAPKLAIHSIPVERDQVLRTTVYEGSVAIEGSSLSNLSKSLSVANKAVVYTALALVLDRHCQASSNTVVIAVEGRYDREQYPLKLQLTPSTQVSDVVRLTSHLDAAAAFHAFIGYDNIKAEHAVAACDFKIIVASEDDSLDDTDHRFPITILVRAGANISVMARHDTAIPAAKLQVLMDHFMFALANIIGRPLVPLSSINIISDVEHTFLLDMAMPQTEPVYDCVQSIFERQVELTPNAPALQFEDSKPLSYAELNSVSNLVARQLPAARGSFVPVCLQRSVNLVVSMVAIVKTGAAYVILDPETPKERNNFIANDVDADFVIVDRSTAGRFHNELVIEDLIERSGRAKDTNLGRLCDPRDPIYVIYTSGSTGNPKGVLHIHSSAASGLAAFPTLPKLRQLLFHNPVFSAAQRSVWSTLKQGGCLCLASKDNLTTHISRTINQMQINVIDVTPSTALLIEPGTVPCLKRMTVAGELINPALIPTWVNKLELLNAYGLSENTQVNWRREMILGQNPQNIGRPSDTTSAYVLDPGTTLLSPLLVPGELCLGGHQLAVRYLNRPEKTAEAFITNPFAPGRLYRTGDMVVTHEDGSIEMVGRIDFQVKINGQRVEPGDSNAIIQTHANVYTSSVVSATVGGRKALVAVVVAKPAIDWSVLRSELKALLKQHISGYMTPSYWLMEKELPLNVNGKVDVPKLAKYVESLSRDDILECSTGGSKNRPSGEHLDLDTVRTLPEKLSADASKFRDIWADILSLEASRISTEDFFQELGGSSLDAIQVASRAYQINLQVSVASILRLPFGEIINEAMQIGTEENSPYVRPFSLLPRNSKLDLREIDDAFPTTSLQDAFLADSLLGNSTYVYRRYYRMQGRQASDIHAALMTLTKTDPVLRTTFILNKASFLQVVRKRAKLSWENLDVSAEEFSLMPKRTIELGGDFVHFDNLSSQILVVTMHHALFDFWSADFLVNDLVSVLKGQKVLTRPSYANYVQHLKQQDRTEMEAFWKSKLQGTLPSCLGYISGKSNVVTVEIHDDLQVFATSHKVSVGSLIYAAWAVVLFMHTSKNDIVFGATLSGRDVPVSGILRMSGPTISTVPFKANIDPDQTLLDLARTIQEDLWAYSGPSQLGIRDILKASGHKAGLYDTLVNILIRDESNSVNSRDTRLVPCGPQEPNHVELTMIEAELKSTGMQLRLLSKIQEQKASFILSNVAETIKTFIRQPSAVIGDINFTSSEEAVLLDSLSIEKPTEPNMLAHSLFERMAMLYPRKTALQDLHGTKVSYQDLDIKANNLARYLRSKGATTGSIIPICMQKSPNTLVTVLAILKSGAAFSPLDPKNPKDRNNFIISDSGATITITDNVHGQVFADFKGDVINMDLLLSLDEATPKFTPEDLSPSNLAYIIYTSGSTGVPKGVQVSHGAVAASTEGMIEACNVDKDWSVLWFLNYVFDASYFDVFTVLGSGGTISIADQETLVNDLARCVNQFKTKQLMITPTISKLISPDDVPTIQTLLVCGEPITPDVASKWASRMDVYNGYGPTEATILMTVSKVKTDGNLRSIGYPLKAVKPSILHPETLRPVPNGDVGELCVSGAQVAIGYLNRPEMTASSFLKMDDGSVIYRTGDYSRWLPNGEIECLGRKDSQIKLNGFRIELGEIETAILKNTGDLIHNCVVGVAQIQKKAGIVVYYVPVETPDILGQKAAAAVQTELISHSIIDPALLLSRLTGLAHYMIPRVFIPFWSFPTLPSGKIDRKSLKCFAEQLRPDALAQYTVAAGAVKNDENPSELTEMEKILRSAWAELFDVNEEDIRASDLFYNHGGDSIAAINLVSMLRRLNYSLSVNEVVSYPLLREQASRMKPSRVGSTSVVKNEFVVVQSVHDRLRAAGITAEDIEDIYACAPGQVEFLTQGHTEHQFWQLMTVRRLPVGFDLDRWTELTRKLTASNQILRAMYLKQNEDDVLSWVQVIIKDPVMDMTIIDCDTEEQKTMFIKQHWDQHFSLGKPFVRYLVLRYADGTTDLCTKLDHAMYDGTLLRIFDDQFAALRDGTPMPELVPFKSFVEYCNEESERTRMLSFWKEHLQSSTFDYPANLSNSKPAGVVVDKINLPVEVYAQTVSVTASTVFQTAYTLLLARLSGQTDVTYDYLVTGRNVDMEDPQLITGTCANFLPFRSHWENTTTEVATLLRNTQNSFWQMTENGLVGLGDIYRALGRDRRTAAAKTLFLFQPFEPVALGEEQDHMRWVVMSMSKVTMFVNYSIMFEVSKDLQGNRLKMQYDTRLFTREQAVGAMKVYVEIVREICNETKTIVGELL